MWAKINKRRLIVTVVLAASCTYFWFANDYTTRRPVEVTVVGHQTVPGGHKYPGSLYLIVKNDEWGMFDIEVGPKTYWYKDGEVLTFNLSREQIRSTQRESFLWLLLPAIAWTLLILYPIFAPFWTRGIIDGIRQELRDSDE